MFSVFLSFGTPFPRGLYSFSTIDNNNNIHYWYHIWCSNWFYMTFSVVLSVDACFTSGLWSLSIIDNNKNHHYWSHIQCSDWLYGTFSLYPSVGMSSVSHSNPSLSLSDDSLVDSCSDLGSGSVIGTLWGLVSLHFQHQHQHQHLFLWHDCIIGYTLGPLVGQFFGSFTSNKWTGFFCSLVW